ncbi:MAG TPA: SBBP repeat-containing protein [Pyrinomonadaceae bacterium]
MHKSTKARLVKFGAVRITFGVAVCLFLLISYLNVSTASNNSHHSSQKDTTPEVSVNKGYGKLPLSFEVNRGQTEDRFRFLARGSGYSIFLTSDEALLQFRKPMTKQSDQSQRRVETAPSAIRNTEASVVRMRLLGAKAKLAATGLNELPGKANYFIGNDQKKWRTNIPTYAKVKFEGVYPGVDLIYYGDNQSQLENDFVINPGGDPRNIAIAFDGVDRLSLDVKGNLVLTRADGNLTLSKPIIYQERDGVRQIISGGYTLKSANQVAFEVGSYDLRKPLVIDPVLVYSTYLGGTGQDAGIGIAVSKHGETFLTGFTTSLNFPPNPAQKIGPGGNFDAFVLKLNAAGNQIAYSTYLGGTNDENFYGSISYGGIAVDINGNAYATGITLSNDFPTKNPFPSPKPGVGAGSPFNGGVADAFITKLDSNGALAYSSYVGGTGFDGAFSVAVDGVGQAYLTGLSGSTNHDFPVTFNAFQSQFGGGSIAADGFVTVLNRTGDLVVYSSYLGGSGNEYFTGIAVDFPGNFYLVGAGDSPNMPVTANAYQPTLKGATDIFIVKGNTFGAINYLTYLGGSDNNDAERTISHGIAVDFKGNIYATGMTSSSDFPSNNPPTSHTPSDAFVVKLDISQPPSNQLIYTTFLGGGGTDFGAGIAVDINGNAYVGGASGGTFPTTPGLPFCTDPGAFVVKLDPVGAVKYSTCLSGAGQDTGLDIALDPAGCAYVTGFSESSNYPVVNALQPLFAGGTGPVPNDAFVTKLCSGLDHFKCYDVKSQAIFLPFEVQLRDQFERQVVTVVRPVTLCNPVVKCIDGDCGGVVNPDDHLVCYETKDAQGTPNFVKQEVIVSNQFGAQQHLQAWRRTNLMCLPSLKAHDRETR